METVLIGFSKIACTDWYVTAVAIRYLENGHPPIPTSDTLGIYKALERARYPGERSLQHDLYRKSKESTVH